MVIKTLFDRLDKHFYIIINHIEGYFKRGDIKFSILFEKILYFVAR